MCIAKLILRLVLGLGLTAFGLNKFIGFMPPPPLEGDAASFMGALVESGYIMPVVGGVETVVGILLLTGLFVPLALVLLAPISVNIVLFHLMLDPANIVPAAAVALLNVVLMFFYLPAYKSLLKPKP